MSPQPSAFERGIAELDRYFIRLEDAALGRAVNALRQATVDDPENVRAWVAFGFVSDAADEPEQALSALRTAAELDPEDDEVAVFLATLRAELGPEAEAMAAVEALAQRCGVDLEALRRELKQAGMPADSRTLLMNGFVHARNFLRSRLLDVVEEFHQAGDPGRRGRHLAVEERECGEMQRELRDSVNAGGVPAGFREVVPWVVRLGVGDDVCRRELFERLADDERRDLLRVLRPHATAIHAWLDSFGETPMTPEAAAFMYLLLGVEEAG